MKLIALLAIVLTGCVTVTVQAPSKTQAVHTLPQGGRTPAANSSPTINVHITQLFCADGKFYFKAESKATDYPNHTSCATLAQDDMNSFAALSLYLDDLSVPGNFADLILEKALKQTKMSFRDMPADEARSYKIRSGQCGQKLVFLVNPAANDIARDSEFCRFDSALVVSSRLPVSGIYSRVSGQTMKSFLEILQGSR